MKITFLQYLTSLELPFYFIYFSLINLILVGRWRFKDEMGSNLLLYLFAAKPFPKRIGVNSESSFKFN